MQQADRSNGAPLEWIPELQPRMGTVITLPGRPGLVPATRHRPDLIPLNLQLPDLILLNLHLPGLGGAALPAGCRRNGKRNRRVKL